MENMKIYLDCDGTWINLYGVENWLEMLRAYDPTPYIVAKPMVNLSWLARTIHELQAQGFKIGIISWLRHQDKEEDTVIISSLSKKEITIALLSQLVLFWIYYFILKAFNTDL